jgi:hypothetical protein
MSDISRQFGAGLLPDYPDSLDEATEQVKIVTLDPKAFREYALLPDKVAERLVSAGIDDGSPALCRRLRRSLEEAIKNDPKLAKERDQLFELCRSANLIVHHPRLRADYFRNPGKVLAWAVPRRGLLERISPVAARGTRDRRAALGDAIEFLISNDPRLVSAREAAFEKNVFLREALRNPEWTFAAIVALSIMAFATGIGLLVGAFLAAVYGDGTTEKAMLGGLSGAGGMATILGTILVLSVDSIRRANGDNAELRLILTDFATAITHYRAISISDFKDALERNQAIHRLTVDAVRKIQEFAEPKETGKAGAGQER